MLMKKHIQLVLKHFVNDLRLNFDHALAGMLADFTGQYNYVFFFCSVSVSTASLFIMMSFYWLDRQSKKEKKRPFSEHIHYLKPSISMAADVGSNQVPLHKRKVQDTDTATNI